MVPAVATGRGRSHIEGLVAVVHAASSTLHRRELGNVPVRGREGERLGRDLALARPRRDEGDGHVGERLSRQLDSERHGGPELADRRTPRSGEDDVAAREQPQVSRLQHRGDRHRGLDATDRHLERPVAARPQATGRIIAGRDIGAGQCGQTPDEGASVRTRPSVAAPQHQVGIGGQTRRPAGDLAGTRTQGGQVQRGSTEADRAVVAVTKEVHGRVGPLLARQCTVERGDAVLARRDHDHVDRATGDALGLEVTDQARGIGHAGVDHGQFAGLRGDGVGRLRGRGGEVGGGGRDPRHLGGRVGGRVDCGRVGHGGARRVAGMQQSGLERLDRGRASAMKTRPVHLRRIGAAPRKMRMASDGWSTAAPVRRTAA